VTTIVAYDFLDPAAQAERRAQWSKAIDEALAALDLRPELESSVYSELDADRNIVTHNPKS
jgi:hypothetical protein